MIYTVIIPAYNEQNFIGQMLESLAQQTVLPGQAILVDDNSSDNTFLIASEFAVAHSWLKVVTTKSENTHLPGSKVINAFNFGLENADRPFDIIVKLDADLVLPENYFEMVLQAFEKPKTGMAGGFCYIEKNGEWVLENLTDKDHIRGALKAYRKECFDQIGGLKPAMGWDTVDELLARFHGWNIITLPELKVKHLKPTGANYDKSARFKQGEAFYSLGYGFWITAIASIKLAIRKGKPQLFTDYISGFFKAKRESKPMLVNSQEARFIRNYRVSKMKEKIFNR